MKDIIGETGILRWRKIKMLDKQLIEEMMDEPTQGSYNESHLLYLEPKVDWDSVLVYLTECCYPNGIYFFNF